MGLGRWDEKCVQNYGEEQVHGFIDAHFCVSQRKCLLIAAAGFDPRSTVVAKGLARKLGDRLSIILIREHRPEPDPDLVRMGDHNIQIFRTICNDVELFQINIFANDGMVIGGRQVLAEMNTIDLSEVDDVILDVSAMSIGVSYPTAKFLFEKTKLQSENFNFHVMLASNPKLDSEAIKSEPNDAPTYVRGFEVVDLMADGKKMPRFWLPLVSEKKLPLLNLIYDDLSPEDVCPILPFPSEVDPKKTDRIASALWAGIERGVAGMERNYWELDPKNFVYAGERIPLDIYRTILRIEKERAPVFEVLGGSKLILSPMGSKIPSLGALMAALDKEFSVVYVESLKYTFIKEKAIDVLDGQTQLSHVWLVGEAYCD